MTELRQTVRLHRTQAEFHHSDAPYRGFVGGRGAGKSWIGAYDLIRRAKRGRLYGVYAPTYTMLKDASFRTFTGLAEQLHFLVAVNRSDLRATLGNGAEVLFRSMDDPDKARGANLSGAWLDEASLMDRAAYEVVIAALREDGEQGWLSATFTPKGKTHWTYEVFGTGRQDTALFRARTKDNPFLPASFYDAVRGQYPGQLSAQELEGEFVDIEGALAKREWFQIVETVPIFARRLRFWDMAATEKSAKSDDPDWTVGAKWAEYEGVYYIEHVIRERVAAASVMGFIRQTAEADGQEVQVRWEQEGGSSGKIVAAEMAKALAGFSFAPVGVHKDKVVRAMPWLAQAQAGNVKLVRGPWNMAWLDEICAFPMGNHDDQVDAGSGAFAALAGRQQRPARSYQG